MKVTDLTELVVASPNDVIPIVDVSEDITKKLQINNLPVPTGVQTALNDKEDLTNKSTSVTTDQASNTKYPSVKAVYDWAVGLFATLTQLATKQDTLVSGTNIKTVNSTSLLGSGDISISANPSGVAGSIQFSDGSAFASVGTNVPTVQFEVQGNSRLRGGLNINGTIINSASGIVDIFGLLYSNSVVNGIGVGISTPTARLQVRGSGATSATTALLVQNSAGESSLRVLDNGSVTNYGKGGIDSNTAFGLSSLISVTNGFFNTAFGSEALRNVAGGISNTAVGVQCGIAMTTAQGNTAVGVQAASGVTNGSRNVAFGFRSLFSVTTANDNVAIGHSAMRNATSGNDNVVIGNNAETSNFSGSVILGKDATATASNQFVVGSSGTNAGTITTETITPDTTWTVRINGANYKIPLLAI